MFIFVGFMDSLKCYKLFYSVIYKFYYVRSVIVNESVIMDSLFNNLFILSSYEVVDIYLEAGGDDVDYEVDYDVVDYDADSGDSGN